MAWPISASDLTLAAATGAITLIDPDRYPPRLVRAYRLSITGTTGAGAYWVAGQAPGGRPGPLVRAGIAAAAAALALGAVVVGERVDRGLQSWLTARGVRHPRVVIAVGATATSLALSAIDDRWPASDQPPG